MMMLHKGCGGTITEDTTIMYDYEHEAGKISRHPALRCSKCFQEIAGDPEIEFGDENGDPHEYYNQLYDLSEDIKPDETFEETELRRK